MKQIYSVQIDFDPSAFDIACHMSDRGLCTAFPTEHLLLEANRAREGVVRNMDRGKRKDYNMAVVDNFGIGALRAKSLNKNYRRRSAQNLLVLKAADRRNFLADAVVTEIPCTTDRRNLRSEF